jgi:hypothetical protein
MMRFLVALKNATCLNEDNSLPKITLEDFFMLSTIAFTRFVLPDDIFGFFINQMNEGEISLGFNLGLVFLLQWL